MERDNGLPPHIHDDEGNPIENPDYELEKGPYLRGGRPVDRDCLAFTLCRYFYGSHGQPKRCEYLHPSNGWLAFEGFDLIEPFLIIDGLQLHSLLNTEIDPASDAIVHEVVDRVQEIVKLF